MKKQTAWKEFREGGERFRIRASYGIDEDFARRNNQDPHFSVTGEIERYNGLRWKDYASGMIHEEIAKHFPELSDYLKWHLVSTVEPMHYIANAKYWWEMATGTGEWKRRPEDPDPVQAFKSTIIFDGIQGEKIPPLSMSWFDVEVWLRGRLPYLMENFRADMKELGVL